MNKAVIIKHDTGQRIKQNSRANYAKFAEAFSQKTMVSFVT